MSASLEAQPHLVEVGEVPLTPQWQRVEFEEPFVDPVVIANVAGVGGGAAGRIGMRRVEPTGFEIRVEQAIYRVGTPLSAIAGFLVLERGIYTLSDGTLMEAGNVVATPSVASHTISFSRSFNRLPVVMTAVSGDDEVAPVMSRIQFVTKSALCVDLYGGGAATHDHGHARLSYIAWEPPIGTLQGIAFEAQKAAWMGRGQSQSLDFLGAFDAPPVLLAEVQEGGSGSLLTLSLDASRTDGVEVTVNGEPLGADVYGPSTEMVVGYIALR